MPGVYVGVDGGASRVRVLAVDGRASRGVFLEKRATANVLYAEPGELAVLLAGLVARAAAGLGGGGEVYVYAALAGMDAGRLSVERARAIEDRLAERGIEAVVDHDLLAAWATARLEGAEAAAVAGSGSAFIHYNESTGTRLILGNHGPALGDEGSAHDIGARALKRLRRALQGLQPHDCLTATLAEALPAETSEDLAAWTYTHGPIQAPLKTTPLVLQAAETGCQAAANLVKEAAASLAKIIDAGAKATRARTVKAYGGLTRSKHYMETLNRKTRNATVEPGRTEPAAGAAWLALQYYSDNLPVTDTHFLNLVKRIINTKLR